MLVHRRRSLVLVFPPTGVHRGDMNERTLSMTPIVRRASDLQSLGLTDRNIRTQVDRGDLVRLHRGVYAQPTPRPEDPFTAARHDHLLRADAALTALPGSYLVGLSACIAHGFPVLCVPTAVSLSRHSRVRTERPGIVTRRAWSHDLEDADGRLVQAAPAAIVETAAGNGVLDALVPADVAARRGLVPSASAEGWSEPLAAWGVRYGARRARQAVGLIDASRESPLETETAWTAHRFGIDLEAQTVILTPTGDFVARVDFTVQGYAVIVEVDGVGKYRSHVDFHQERKRHNLIEELGWIVVRVTHEDLRHGRFEARLRTAVARAPRRTT